MRKSIMIFFIQLFLCFTVSAQFFSGYYVSDTTIEYFDHLKIHHHHSSHHKYEGDLTVQAFASHGELWSLPASMIEGEKAYYFIEKFAGDNKIKTVYEFKIAFDGIEEDFILMGYETKDGHPAFVAVEEIFDSKEEVNLLELKAFKLIKAHHLE